MAEGDKKDIQQLAVCPNCKYQGRYWYRSLQNAIARCHVCETPLNEGCIIIR